MNHLKLVVVGPTECGKSYLCNFLSESVEQVTEEYRPTCGVRIIEYELNTTTVNKPCKVELELWDLSGNKKLVFRLVVLLVLQIHMCRYENCWPACFKGSHGVIFVYNPDNSEHIKELEDWYTFIFC
ncbi:intraflagellar transport protein 22 [Paragonimus westermani]|uniref:Intraflagellar transport protein 22 n=1 Tax=Paragonimus westermani TaxID=34504 RepID=A0A5J4NB98_9TREM|nr:intraflagellar transport protein 22 [Paragonimus westermani]